MAFDAVADPSLIILQNLFAGMNAHIDYDLGIAAAQIAGSMEGLSSLHDDFNKINALLACLVPTVFTEIGELSPLIHLVEDFGESEEENLVDRMMDMARDFSWLFANELVVLKDLPDLRNDLMGLKDREVSWLGQGIVQPGGSMEKILHVIWLAESKDVAKNIEVLAAPATLPASCG